MIQLNSEQAKAANTLNGNLLIIASAGTGKTTTIVERYANLIEKEGYNPEEIMMTTFTNKAAKDMIKKINNKTDKVSSYIGTMHSLFLRILRDNKEVAFHGKDYTLITENAEQKKILKEILESVELPINSNSVKYFLSWISKFKNRGILAEDLAWEGGIDEAREKGYITEMLDDEMIEVDSSWRTEVNKVYKKYQEFLHEKNLLDFDEILILTYRLLNDNPDILAKYKKQFRAIMVDEAQDLNVIQVRILELIRDNNLCLIGDDCQNIYEWRGSSNDLIFNFKENEENIFLEENYRSTDEIIKTVNTTIDSLNNKIDKKLLSTRGSGHKVNLEFFGDHNEEMDFVVTAIERLIDKGEKLDDISVLFRTNMIGKGVEREMRRRGIPCHLAKTVGFFNREEIHDLLSFLKLIANPNSYLDLDRIVSLIPGLGKAKINSIVNYANENSMSLVDVLRNNKELKFPEPISYGLEEIAKALDNPEPIVAFLENFGYYGYMERKYAMETRKLEDKFENIKTFLDMLNAHEGDSVISFLDSLLDIEKKEKTSDKVVLTTIHGAKGLEWKHVYLIACNEQTLPFYKENLSPSKRDAELRLFYVAISRAKDFLTISTARNQGFKFTKPSQFMELIYEPFGF